jgi:hypothetical protein
VPIAVLRPGHESGPVAPAGRISPRDPMKKN